MLIRPKDILCDQRIIKDYLKGMDDLWFDSKEQAQRFFGSQTKIVSWEEKEEVGNNGE